MDWLYAHDLTKLFAGIASRARQVFGISAQQIHVDTTSFSVSGEYTGAQEEEDTTVIAITYGYSRDHRAYLKQWMLALAATHDGDVPVYMQPLNGNSSDKVSLLATITAIETQLQEAGEEPDVFVADNGVYSRINTKQLNLAGIKWVSRVSQTLSEAKTLLEQGSQSWQQSEDATVHWFSRELDLPQGRERWVVVYTQESLQRAQQSMQRQVSKAQTVCERDMLASGEPPLACQGDAVRPSSVS